MKLVKSLLLGSAAGIVAVGSAVAADLPVRKAAPVDYVQVCSQFGTGYFFIPGTDTCLRVGGLVRWQYRLTENKWGVGATTGTLNADGEVTGFNVADHSLSRDRQTNQFARAELRANALTATEFGTLGSYILLRGDQGGSMNVVEAYIQFAGITAGRAPSFFGYGGTTDYQGGFGRFGANEGNLIAYTVEAGAIKASVSLEDRASGAIIGPGTPLTSAAVTTFTAGTAGTTANPALWRSSRANTDMPAIIGALEFNPGGMFSGKLSGAVHQLRSNQLINDGFADSKLGFAILGGVNVQFTPATQLRLVATYADGATGYLNASPINNRFNVVLADGFINENNSIRTTQGFSIAANLQHAWTPTITQNVYGAYARITPPSFVRSGRELGEALDIAPFTAGGLPSRYDQWQIGTNVAWTPVSNLTIGADVNYTRLETQHRTAIFAPNGVDADDARFSKHDDRWTATLRIQRAF